MNSSESGSEISAEAKKAELSKKIEELTNLVDNLKRMGEMSPSNLSAGGYYDSAWNIVADAEKGLLKAQMELEALNAGTEKAE